MSPRGDDVPRIPATPRASAAAGRNPLTGEFLDPPPSKAAAAPDTKEAASETRLAPHIPYDGMLMAFGGHDGEGFLSSAESFIPGRAAWRSEADMVQSRAHFASCILNGRVWALGGWDPYNQERMREERSESKALNTVEIFDPQRGSWSLGPKLVSPRAFHGGVALGDSIYVIGGFDGVRDLDLVDRLDTARGTWIRGRPLKLPRSAACCGSIRGRIYVTGGQNGLQGLGTCESFDPREGKWRQEPDMLYHRTYAAAFSAGDCLFVAGGNFGISYLDTVEMYDGRKGAWRMLPSLNIKRNGASLALVGDTLYCLGGFDGENDCLSVTETLDLSKPLAHEPWQLAEELSKRRDGCCVQVVASMTPQWRGR
jgi:influenza virus NS1A-binding protein